MKLKAFRRRKKGFHEGKNGSVRCMRLIKVPNLEMNSEAIETSCKTPSNSVEPLEEGSRLMTIVLKGSKVFAKPLRKFRIRFRKGSVWYLIFVWCKCMNFLKV